MTAKKVHIWAFAPKDAKDPGFISGRIGSIEGSGPITWGSAEKSSRELVNDAFEYCREKGYSPTGNFHIRYEGQKIVGVAVEIGSYEPKFIDDPSEKIEVTLTTAEAEKAKELLREAHERSNKAALASEDAMERLRDLETKLFDLGVLK